MFVTFLKFSANRASASRLMAAHNDWIAKGFTDGVFLCAGSLAAGTGGAIVAHGESREAHDARIAADPFVMEDIVAAETHEIEPKRTADALGFLRAA
ncbi:MAG: hypothetical protein JNL61_04110 [Rhizobiaceae bacterium]|nr:hypothetical protein [Rhizobiaceae bacterium]